MCENDAPDRRQGIASLPRPWSTAVQLVGTFGLAVFLVLYYVLLMQPQERARYDELRQSVEFLIAVVEKGLTLVTADQAKHLESLYVLAVANEVGVFIHDALEKGMEPSVLEAKTSEMMLRRTELLEGLTQKGGKNISETIVHRLATRGGISSKLAEEAVNWKGMSARDISKRCEEILEFSFAERRMKK